MNEIDDEVQSLIETVKQSKVYRQYDMQRTILKGEPELKKQVDEYRIRSYEIQNADDDEHLQERIEAFEAEYADFVEQPKVCEFLEAELDLCRMLQEVTARVVDSLNFE